jgi:hypothetical protein
LRVYQHVGRLEHALFEALQLQLAFDRLFPFAPCGRPPILPLFLLASPAIVLCARNDHGRKNDDDHDRNNNDQAEYACNFFAPLTVAFLSLQDCLYLAFHTIGIPQKQKPRNLGVVHKKSALLGRFGFFSRYREVQPPVRSLGRLHLVGPYADRQAKGQQEAHELPRRDGILCVGHEVAQKPLDLFFAHFVKEHTFPRRLISFLSCLAITRVTLSMLR